MCEKLFHYTKLDIFLNYILKDQTLQLDPLREMNDPYDYKTRFIYANAKSGNKKVQYPLTYFYNPITNKSNDAIMIRIREIIRELNNI